MNCARNCENLLNFVKVIPEILLIPFLPDTVYYRHFTAELFFYKTQQCASCVSLVKGYDEQWVMRTNQA